MDFLTREHTHLKKRTHPCKQHPDQETDHHQHLGVCPSNTLLFDLRFYRLVLPVLKISVNGIIQSAFLFGLTSITQPYIYEILMYFACSYGLIILFTKKNAVTCLSILQLMDTQAVSSLRLVQIVLLQTYDFL